LPETSNLTSRDLRNRRSPIAMIYRARFIAIVLPLSAPSSLSLPISLLSTLNADFLLARAGEHESRARCALQRDSAARA